MLLRIVEHNAAFSAEFLQGLKHQASAIKTSCHSREGGNPDLAHDVAVQIAPVRVTLINKTQLPKAIPFLDLLFSRYRRRNVTGHFKPDQHLYAVFFSEPIS